MGKIYLNGESYGGGAEIEFYDYVYTDGNGGNVIITDIYSSQNKEIYVDFQADGYSNNKCVLGNYGAGITFYQNKLYLGDYNVVNGFSAWSDRHTAIINNINHKNCLDGVEMFDTNSNTWDNRQLVCMGRTDTSTAFIGKIFEYKITDNSTSTILMHLKPAALKLENYIVVHGLYDVVNKVWYKGTNLTVGNVPT